MPTKDLSLKDQIPSLFGMEVPPLTYPDLLQSPGKVKEGNLDPYQRPDLANPDGSYSTTSSMGIGTEDGKEVLIPTVVNGVRLSSEDAIKEYEKNGGNFGTFDNWAKADVYAQKLHEQQATHNDPNAIYLQRLHDTRKHTEAAKATGYDSAMSSVKQGEIDFAKGVGTGIAGGVAEGMGFLLDAVNYAVGGPTAYADYAGRAKDTVTNWLLPDPSPSEKKGMDMGNVTSNFINPELGLEKALLVPLGMLVDASKAKRVDFLGEAYHNIDFTKSRPDFSIFKDKAAHGLPLEAPLKDVISNKEMEQLLPKMSDKVRVKIDDPAMFGSASPNAIGRTEIVKDDKGEISGYVVHLKQDYLNSASPESIHATVVHELQHVTQVEVGLRSLGTSPGAVRTKLERLLSIKDPKKLDRPSEEDMVRISHAMYHSNVGEQEAVLAERLAQGKTSLPMNSKYAWTGETLDDVWRAYLEVKNAVIAK